MKGKILVWLALGGIGLVYAYLVYPLTSQQSGSEKILEKIDTLISSDAVSQSSQVPQLCFQDRCFFIEIADTLEERQQWLMGRTWLLDDRGMLFVFDTSDVYPFWMKNTLIPLDIIWLSDNLTVTATASMTPCTADPCPNYNPEASAKYALEINAWLIEKYNIWVWAVFTRK